MTAIAGIAGEFFEACEAGEGWEGRKEYCTAGATFSAQAEPLAVTDLATVHGLDEAVAHVYS